MLKAHQDVLAYRRSAGDDSRIVLINFSSEAVRIDSAGELGGALAERQVELASDQPEPKARFDDTLGGDQTLILR